MVDHLQFGNPEDPEVFWTFKESLQGLADFAKQLKVPCVGGKVSFYNETQRGPIKPTPLIGVLGLIEKNPLLPISLKKGDLLFLIGNTYDELGGSEYFEYILNFVGGICPEVKFETSKKNMNIVLELIKNNLMKSVHDCSKGGLAIAISEMCIQSDIGCTVSLEKIPSSASTPEQILFSESHSRYLLGVEAKNSKSVKEILTKKGICFGIIGEFLGDKLILKSNSKNYVNLRVNSMKKKWSNSLEDLIHLG